MFVCIYLLKPASPTPGPLSQWQSTFWQPHVFVRAPSPSQSTIYQLSIKPTGGDGGDWLVENAQSGSNKLVTGCAYIDFQLNAHPKSVFLTITLPVHTRRWYLVAVPHSRFNYYIIVTVTRLYHCAYKDRVTPPVLSVRLFGRPISHTDGHQVTALSNS